MFGLNPWVLLAIGIAVAVATGGAYIRGHSDGTDKADLKWTVAFDKQKAEARALLDAEEEKTRAKERDLATLTNRVEADHVAATNAITAAGAKYNRLGLLYERTKARCGSGGGAAVTQPTASPAIDHGRESTGENIPRSADGDSLGRIAEDADVLRVTVLACQDYISKLPATVN